VALSTPASQQQTGPPLFDAIIVDEAAQALEPATLIPFVLLKPGAKVWS
jgi:superfamily I DNA and/or RNA helicase